MYIREEKNYWMEILTVVLVIIVLAGAIGFITVKGFRVNAGEEGVLIKKPWFFGKGGVQETPIKTGLSWGVASTEMVKVNIKPYTINETFDDLVTKDNNPVDFHIHMIFKNIEGKTPILVEKFGKDWYKNNIKEPLRNVTRNFTKNKLMFDMTTNQTTAKELETVVKNEINRVLKEDGIPVKLVMATVGRVFPPKPVIEETVRTAQEKQKVKTQMNRVKAENARIAAEKASAEADKAYMRELGLSNAEYLEMKRLDNERAAIKAASEGKATLNLILGSGNSAKPFFNVSPQN